MPLAVDFSLPSETEAIKSIMDTNVAEHGFDNTESFAVGRSSLNAVKLLLHTFDDAAFSFLCNVLFDVQLPRGLLLGVSQAFRFQRTNRTVFFIGLKLHKQVMSDSALLVFEPHWFTSRTSAYFVFKVDPEVFLSEFVFGFQPVLKLVPLVVFELGITTSKTDVGDVTVDAVFFQPRQGFLIMIAGISSNLRAAPLPFGMAQV